MADSAAVVPITYATHSASHAAAQLPVTIASLSTQLPLRNLHWRPPAAPSLSSTSSAPPPPLRTLPALRVRLVALSAWAAAPDASELERWPYVNLFFVSCDDSDLYRAQVRNEIRAWLAALPTPASDTSAPRAPHMIVYVPMPAVAPGAAASAGAKSGMGRFMSSGKSSVLEKLRADFNSSQCEHVVALSRRPAPSDPDPALWVDVLARIKALTLERLTLVVDAQCAAVDAYEQQVSEGAPKAAPVGGLVTRYEALITTLERLGLLEDAARWYDALRARALATLAQQRGALAPGGDEPGDDSLLLLGPLRKPYASLLASESITRFDLLCYLYARHAMLLGALGDAVAVMELTPALVHDVGAALRRAAPPPLFLEVWTVSVVLDAVEQCQAWLVEAQGEADDPQTTHAFHAARAALLELAVRQLVRVGVQAGHLPPAPPFWHSAPPAPLPSVRHLSRKELVDAMADGGVYDSQLRHLLHRAIVAASRSEQAPRTLRLQFTLASLEAVRASHADAARLFREILAAPLRPDALVFWLPAHAQLLACLRAQDDAHGPRYVEALSDALHALCCVRFQAPTLARALDDAALLDELAGAARALGTQASVLGYNGVDVRPTGAAVTRVRGVAQLAVEVVSHLAAALAVDQVSVWVSNYRQTQLAFACGACTLQPGAQTLVLTCATPLHGYFHVQATQLQRGAVLLECASHAAWQLAALAESPALDYVRERVCLPADGGAPRLDACAPLDVELRERRRVVVEVHAGRDALAHGTLSVTPLGDAALAPWDTLAVECEPPCDASVTPSADGAALELRQVPPRTVCRVSLALTRAPPRTLELLMALRYAAADAPEAWCTLQHHARVDVRLPFRLHIQDFFRLDTLLSKLSLDNVSGGAARVAAPHLDVPDAAGVVAEVPSAAPQVLAPGDSSTYLVRITPRAPTRPADAAPLALRITYRRLADEAYARALLALHERVAACAPAWDDGDEALVCRALRDAADGPFDEAAWRGVCHQWGWAAHGARADAVVDVVRDVWAAAPAQSLAALDAAAPADAGAALAAARRAAPWRTLALPLDVPSVDAVNEVTLRAPPTPHAALGAPVTLSLDVDVSFRWAVGAAHDAAVLQFHIVSDHEQWLVWGQKKGTWTLPRTDTPQRSTIDVTLVPLAPGFLVFPRVRITPVTSGAAFRCETYVKNALAGMYITSPPGPATYWADLRPVEPGST